MLENMHLEETCFKNEFQEKLNRIVPEESLRKMHEKMELLVQQLDWDRETLEQSILSALSHQHDSNNFFEVLCYTIELAFDYRLNQKDFTEKVSDYNNYDRLDEIFNEMIATKTPKTEIKSVQVLICEIEASNSKFNKNKLLEDLTCIEVAFSAIENVTEGDIRLWSENIRRKKGKTSTFEKIAYVWKAMEMTSSLEVRDVQVLTVLMMYEAKSGRLAQVNTGEGKTIIIAMLAALLCLDGPPNLMVDIVTTSPELAVPQSQQLKSFYELLGLSSSNIDKGEKSLAYKCNVVYGSVNEFEGDVLHDKFLKEETRAGREFDIVIVDEADSMLVDGINNMTRLSSPMPGMNTLLPILIEIWDLYEIAEAPARFIEKNENVKTAKRQVLQSFFETKDVPGKIEEDVKVLIEKGKLQVPKHLIDFVLNHQLKIWVQSALTARYRLTLDREYVIEDNEVKIVDLHNSGIVFKNMKWSDGIHQFLQIKNNVQLTCEDLVTNFLGNPTFFLKYKKIFGLTGTLGCDQARKFLEKTYNTDSIIIPPFKAKLHTSLTPIVVAFKDAWYKAIVDSCMTKLNFGRAVLIIADSIAETNQIKEKFLRQGFRSENILMYQTEKDSEICGKLIQPGQVVITTNICGRGVNIFPSSAAPGGLHICLTFLPENSRVEEQNIGRTSRSGNPGTSQLILLGNEKLQDIKKRRDEKNAKKLALMDKDIERTKVKAKVFDKFCVFLDIVETAKIPKEWKIHKKYFSQLQPEQFCGAIKERFGIWLKKNELSYEENPSELLVQYSEFEKLVIKDFSNNRLATENVFFFILSGVKSIRRAKYDAAIEQFTRAIDIDEDCSAFAYLNRAIACVSLKKFEKALDDLKTAKGGIESLIKDTEKMRRLAKKHSEKLETKFKRQIDFLTMTVESIETVIISGFLNGKKILDSKKRSTEIDLVYVNWLKDVPEDQKKISKADAVELVMRGWIGPVEVAKREITFFKKAWNGTVQVYENGREMVGNIVNHKPSIFGPQESPNKEDHSKFENLGENSQLNKI